LLSAETKLVDLMVARTLAFKRCAVQITTRIPAIMTVFFLVKMKDNGCSDELEDNLIIVLYLSYTKL
jgi:hypothetical protein